LNRPILEGYILLLSRVSPFKSRPPAKGWLATAISKGVLFVPPGVYLRFIISSFLYPLVVEIVAWIILPSRLFLPVIITMSAISAFPLLLPTMRAWQRRRGVEAELPFVAMLLYVLSHESFPNINQAFSKMSELGPEVFPSLSTEASILQRNGLYGGESEVSTIESTFASHPSSQFRSFVHGYLVALLTGKNIHSFAQEEAGRFVALLEERWQGFVRLTSTLTEVAFTLLAIFPVGMQMIAVTFLREHSPDLLIFSHLLLIGVSLAIIGLMNWSQPLLHDKKYSLTGTTVLLAAWSLSFILTLEGRLTPAWSLLLPLATSLILVAMSLRHFRLLNKGEEEIGGLLHELAEESRAGTSLPIALRNVVSYTTRFPSTRESLLLMSRLLDLGYDPIEAQKKIPHNSWLVRVAFAILAVAFQTGGGFEQLDKLSLSFRRIRDARRSLSASILPFAILGIFVPVLSSATFWFLSGLASISSFLPGLAPQVPRAGIALSISLTSLLSGLMVTKAYTLSIRNLFAMPPILVATLFSLTFFGM